MPDDRAARTRARILRAAQERVARSGPARATVRDVAADAGVDPALVVRYFGGKAGLVAAATDVGPAPDLALERLATSSAADLGAAVVAHFVHLWEEEPTAAPLRALLAAALPGGDPADALRVLAIFAEQVRPALGRLHPELDDTEAERRAGLVASQLLGLALTRYLVPLAPVAALSRDELVVAVGPTLQRYLDGGESTTVAGRPAP